MEPEGEVGAVAAKLTKTKEQKKRKTVAGSVVAVENIPGLLKTTKKFCVQCLG